MKNRYHLFVTSESLIFFFYLAKEIRDQKNEIRERSVIHLSNNYVVTCYQVPFHYTTKTSSRVYGHEAKNTYSNINKPHIPSINDTITQRIKLEWHSSAKHIKTNIVKKEKRTCGKRNRNSPRKTELSYLFSVEGR